MSDPRRSTLVCGTAARGLLILVAGLMLAVLVAPPGSVSGDHRNETHLSGVLPRLAIGCRFADLAGVTPAGDEQMRALMGDGRSGITAWWQEMSYGAIEPTGEWLGWIDMDGRTRDYLRGGLFILEGGLDTFTAAVRDCAGKAAELTDLGEYDSLDLFFNTALSAWFGNRYELTLGGITKSWGYTWMWASEQFPGAGLSSAVFAHETGHTYGLDHNKSFAGFRSDWGAMGLQGRCGVPLDFNCHSVHITAHQKDRLGWIAPERKAIVLPGSDEVFHLERLAEPGPDGMLLIEIPVPGDPRRFYTLEARKRSGYDVEIYGDAVVIHEVDFNRREESNVVFNPAEQVSAAALAALISPQDENPAAAEGPNGPQGMWTVGEVFEAGSLSPELGGAANSGIRVEVVAETATGFDVRVSVEPSQGSVYRSLEPGWQLVGFTNTPGHVLNTIPVLTAPRLTRALAWDPVDEELLSYGPGDPPEQQTLLQLETGDALWLLLDEDEGSPVIWEQVLIDGPRSVALPAGLSLQTWTGPATPAAEAVAGLGGALESLHVWQGNRFLSYTAGLPDVLNEVRELRYGDAFWIRMSEASSWTQPAPD